MERNGGGREGIKGSKGKKQMRRKNAEAGDEREWREGGRREDGKSEGTGTARRLC